MFEDVRQASRIVRRGAEGDHAGAVLVCAGEMQVGQAAGQIMAVEGDAEGGDGVLHVPTRLRLVGSTQSQPCEAQCHPFWGRGAWLACIVFLRPVDHRFGSVPL